MLGKRLAWLRHSYYLTQEEVSKKLDISRSRYSHYEVGRSEPDIEFLRRIAQLFNVSTDYLLGLIDLPLAIDKQEPKMLKNPEGPNERIRTVPILKTVPTNNSISGEENIESYTYFDSSLIDFSPDDKLFFWRNTGDRMNPLFRKGDLILVRQQSQVDNGQWAMLILPDKDEVLIKKIYEVEKKVFLISSNPDEEPIILSSKHLIIIGRVISKIGWY